MRIGALNSPIKPLLPRISDFGILYIATGDQYFLEACRSAEITSKYSPGVPISLLTDKHRPDVSNVFDVVDILPNPSFGYRDKVSGLGIFDKYAATLFLDTDAFAIAPLNNLQSIVENFDISACAAPVSHPPGWTDSSVPLYFPEYNTGFLLYKRGDEIFQCFQSWLGLYDQLLLQSSQTWDQASFRSVLWPLISNNQLRFLHLPSEYNLRTTKPWTASRGNPVSIIHGRFDHAELDHFITYLNSNIDCFRTWAHWLSQYPLSTIRPRYDNTRYDLFS